MSFVYFFNPLYVCKGLCSWHCRFIPETKVGYFGFRYSAELPLWDLHPRTEKEKAEIRDYIVATDDL